jgi:hypothetical protein
MVKRDELPQYRLEDTAAQLGQRGALNVEAHVGFESKVGKRYFIIQFQALSSRRFQRGFDGVNLHRPTLDVSASSLVSRFRGY